VRSILCFGDSNTWGHNPEDMTRLPYWGRWPTVLQKRLGAEHLVIPEGLNGRTTVFDDPLAPHRSGIAFLPMVLESHAPLDLVLIMLGTNDVKRYFGVSAEQSALGLRLLVMTVLGSEAGPDGRAPQLLVVAPVPLSSFDEQMLPHFAPEEEAIEKSRALAPAYRRVAEELGVLFFDAGSMVSSAGVDGVHLDEEGHRRLGEGLGDWIGEHV
jgi:lysophospholipase L1-like esterase